MTLDGAGGLYVAGSMQFTPEKGNPAVLAQVAISTSVATAVVPYYETPRSLARTPVSGTSGPLVLVRSGGNLLVAGDFSDYGITDPQRAGGLRASPPARSSRLRPDPDAQVNIVKASADNSAVFVGGEFVTHRRRDTQPAGQAGHRHRRERCRGSTRPRTPTSRTWRSAPTGARLYVGGNFDVVQRRPQPATGRDRRRHRSAAGQLLDAVDRADERRPARAACGRWPCLPTRPG